MSGAQLPLLAEAADIALGITIVLLQAFIGFMAGFALGYFLEGETRE